MARPAVAPSTSRFIPVGHRLGTDWDPLIADQRRASVPRLVPNRGQAHRWKATYGTWVRSCDGHKRTVSYIHKGRKRSDRDRILQSATEDIRIFRPERIPSPGDMIRRDPLSFAPLDFIAVLGGDASRRVKSNHSVRVRSESTQRRFVRSSGYVRRLTDAVLGASRRFKSGAGYPECYTASETYWIDLS